MRLVLVLVLGRWLTGSALDAENAVLERTGKPLSVRAVHFGEAPLSLLLGLGQVPARGERG